MDALRNNMKVFTGPVTLTNIASRTIQLMLWVEEIHDLAGPQKKQMILALVKESVDDGDDATNSVLERVMPELIDSLIAVDKGRLTFHVPWYRSCLAFCTENPRRPR